MLRFGLISVASVVLWGGVVSGCTASVERTSPTTSGGSAAPPGSPTNPDTGAVQPAPGSFVGPNSGTPSINGTPITLAPTVLRRLTGDEYRTTLRDLLQLPTLPTRELVPDARSMGYDNFAAALTVSGTLASQFETLASDLASQANVALLAPCTTLPEDASCAAAFIRDFGKRALRRPLAPEEEQRYAGLYALGREGGSYEEGIRVVLQAFLASPTLLYRSELGEAVSAERRLLTHYEIASALSYLITGSTPDTELLAAADARALGTPAEVEVQARRLLASNSARGALRKFITQWFGIASLDALAKDPLAFPEFTPELRASMGAESGAFIDATLWDRAGSVASLLASPASFVDARLAALYGASASAKGAELVPAELNPGERAGLLTHASVLSVHSKRSDSFPIARGKFIRKSLLCQSLPDPPPDVVIAAPPPDPNVTTRQRFAQHSANPTCSSCHALMDPLGFGLENYDAIGRFRTIENGMPVDAAGMLTGTPDADGPFSGGVELAAKLTQSRLLGECAAIQATRFAFGRPDTASDRAVAASIADLLGGAKLDVRELLITLAKTEGFFVRAALKDLP